MAWRTQLLTIAKRLSLRYSHNIDFLTTSYVIHQEIIIILLIIFANHQRN